MKTHDNQRIVLFNPLPVSSVEEHATTSSKVPLVNAPLSLLAIARMVEGTYDVRIINAVVDADYTEKILAACDRALLFAVSSMTCYQIRDGLNVSAASGRLGWLPPLHHVRADDSEPTHRYRGAGAGRDHIQGGCGATALR